MSLGSITYGTPSTDRVVADLQQIARRLESAPWLNGRLIENVALGAGANTIIRNPLGRVPRGWWVVSFSGAAASDYPRQVAATTSELVLTVTNAAVASLWVF